MFWWGTLIRGTNQSWLSLYICKSHVLSLRLRFFGNSVQFGFFGMCCNSRFLLLLY